MWCSWRFSPFGSRVSESLLFPKYSGNGEVPARFPQHKWRDENMQRRSTFHRTFSYSRALASCACCGFCVRLVGGGHSDRWCDGWRIELKIAETIFLHYSVLTSTDCDAAVVSVHLNRRVSLHAAAAAFQHLAHVHGRTTKARKAL